jgi:hypothetical protein
VLLVLDEVALGGTNQLGPVKVLGQPRCGIGLEHHIANVAPHDEAILIDSGFEPVNHWLKAPPTEKAPRKGVFLAAALLARILAGFS